MFISKETMDRAINDLYEVEREAEKLCFAATEAWGWVSRNADHLLPKALFVNLIRVLGMPVPDEVLHKRIFETVRALDNGSDDEDDLMGVWQSMTLCVDVNGYVVLSWDKDDCLSTAKEELLRPGVREKLFKAVCEACADWTMPAMAGVFWPDKVCSFK